MLVKHGELLNLHDIAVLDGNPKSSYDDAVGAGIVCDKFTAFVASENGTVVNVEMAIGSGHPGSAKSFAHLILITVAPQVKLSGLPGCDRSLKPHHPIG